MQARSAKLGNQSLVRSSPKSSPARGGRYVKIVSLGGKVNIFKAGGKWRKLIALAMIAVPWFLRDQLAARMDKRATVAQQVLTEKNDQQQRQEQVQDQRETLDRLKDIQAKLDEVDAKVEGKDENEIQKRADESYVKLTSDLFEEEGLALNQSADNFDGLLKKVDMDSATSRKLEEMAEQAGNTADKLLAFNSNPQEDDIESLFDELSDTQDKLVDGYEKLDTAATKERDESTRRADFFRNLAWVFTGIGAVLMGDWKKLFGGSDDEKDEDDVQVKAAGRS
jgi:hypothetical protein